MVGFCSVCGSLLYPGGICPVCGVPKKKEEETPANILKPEEVTLELFPYKPREIQKAIVEDIYSAVSNGNHIVFESGTGTGKTITSLAGVLRHTLDRGKKVIYLTRTISQSNQVMRELKAISSLRNVYGMTLTGRNKSCPLLKTLSAAEALHPSVLANLCEDKKKKCNSGSAGGCPYFYNLKKEIVVIEAYCKNNHPTSDQLDSYCEDLSVCPYEAKKMLMKYMDVIVAPYIHILSEDIRDGFLGNLESNGSDLCMIIDEAHNIIDAARDQESFTITTALVDAAEDEVTTFHGDPTIYEGVYLSLFIKEVKKTIKSLADEKIPMGKKEEIVKLEEIAGKIKTKFDLNANELDIAIGQMINYGETRTEMLIERGENRISDIYQLGVCLNNMFSSFEERFIYSINIGNDDTFLKAVCINPQNVTDFIRNVKGVVHMSGTLQPLQQYARVMNLPEGTLMKTYPSPFPKSNKSVIYLNNVTTKYDEMQKDKTMMSRIEKDIAKLCNCVNKNTLVFFTSYSFMEKMRDYLERDVHKNKYWEVSKQPKKTAEALEKFRAGRNGVFFSVMGGSVAEGIDFPGEELCFAIIVGIPFPPPSLESKAISEMFDKKYGRGIGWKYTSEVPAMRKMQQAIGRLIRTETDRGMAVILDSRTAKYATTLEAKLSTDPVGDTVRFFSE